MKDVYVVHYHEIALKGRNRPMFLRALKENICRATGLPEKCVRIASGRLIVDPSPGLRPSSPAGRGIINCPSPRGRGPASPDERASRGGEGEGAIVKSLAHVFGISSFSPAVLVNAKYDEIEKIVYDIARNPLQLPLTLRGREWSTFAIAATRGDKKFALTSHDLEVKLGDAVRTKLDKKVNLKNPDITFYVEVFPGGALVYTEKILGAGGLPIGTQPPVAVLLSGGIDSPVAAHRIMKRGAPAMAVHFHSYPFTSRASIDKVKELAGILAGYGLRKLYIVPLGEAQKEVVQKTEGKYRVLLYRRLMVRIAEALARKEGAQALVTGESLGQVASQTLENMAVTEASARMPILRPLIGFDKEEIIMEAKKIGTFEISILPHDDCCTLLVPKNPATRARLADVEYEEQKLDIAELVNETLKKAELITMD